MDMIHKGKEYLLKENTTSLLQHVSVVVRS